MWCSQSRMGVFTRLQQSVRETREHTKVTKHKHGAYLLPYSLALDRDKVFRNKHGALALSGRLISARNGVDGLQVTTCLHVNVLYSSDLNSWYVLLGF